MQMQYTSSSIPKFRQELSTLVREAGDVVDVKTAARILDLDSTTTAKKLARWTEQGWLRRITKGVYVVVSVETLINEIVISDPWILVPHLYGEAYIGGRTAAEHWDLTEQIFNDVVVLTSKPIRNKVQLHQGVRYSLKHTHKTKLFGLKTVWRRHTKVSVSDPHRTLIDMLDDPVLGAGLQHTADCLARYLKRLDRNDEALIGYAKRLGNGAVFKRLGFLLERHAGTQWLQLQCGQLLTQGVSRLDPSVPEGKIVSRWHLLVPDHWLEEPHR